MKIQIKIEFDTSEPFNLPIDTKVLMLKDFLLRVGGSIETEKESEREES